jgi:hypothetical protein
MNQMVSGRFLFGIFFIITLTFYGQERIPDSVRAVSATTKPLQTLQDFSILSPVEVILFDKDETVITEFSKDYIYKNLTYDPIRDPKRLAYNSGLFVGGAVVAFGLLWIMPESVTSWDKDEIREEGLINKWEENVKAGPIWDKDGFFFNWITHPWAGAVYYMSARGSGFKPWESFTYSVLFSTFFWEYGVEAFAEVPSWQDIIITPTVGSLFGEGFFIAKKKIVENDHRILKSRALGVTTLILMDPFNEILDGLGYKTKNKMQTYSTFAPIQYDYISKKPVWGLTVAVNF